MNFCDLPETDANSKYPIPYIHFDSKITHSTIENLNENDTNDGFSHDTFVDVRKPLNI
jgi:hypothetical protein